MDNGKPQNKAPENTTPVDGAAIAAQILRKMPAAQRSKLVVTITESNPVLAEQIKERMYAVSELTRISPQAAQALIREIEHRDLAVTLQKAEPELKEVLLASMSERKREMVLDTAETLPAAAPAAVKEAQWRILDKLEELKERAKTQLATKRGTWA